MYIYTDTAYYYVAFVCFTVKTKEKKRCPSREVRGRRQADQSGASGERERDRITLSLSLSLFLSPAAAVRGKVLRGNSAPHAIKEPDAHRTVARGGSSTSGSLCARAYACVYTYYSSFLF